MKKLKTISAVAALTFVGLIYPSDAAFLSSDNAGAGISTQVSESAPLVTEGKSGFFIPSHDFSSQTSVFDETSGVAALPALLDDAGPYFITHAQLNPYELVDRNRDSAGLILLGLGGTLYTEHQIVFGNSTAQVAPVPELSTGVLALLALTALALWQWQSKRKTPSSLGALTLRF